MGTAHAYEWMFLTKKPGCQFLLDSEEVRVGRLSASLMQTMRLLLETNGIPLPAQDLIALSLPIERRMEAMQEAFRVGMAARADLF